MATLVLEGVTGATITHMEATKTATDRWREVSTPPNSFFGVLATVAGGLVVSQALGARYPVPAFAAGCVGGNFLFNTLREDLDPALAAMQKAEQALQKEASNYQAIAGDHSLMLQAAADGASFGTVSDLTPAEQKEWDDTDWSTATRATFSAN